MDNEILEKALNNEKNNSITKLNSAKIKKIKEDIIDELELQKKERADMLRKLYYYRLVDEIPELEYGRYIRWINLNKPEIKLTNGSIIVGVDIYDSGVHIKCKNNMNRIFQIKLNDNIIFQQLTDEELVILKVLDYLER